MLLKEKIKNKGIKQTWIAEKIGISKSLLHHYLSGHTSIPNDVETKIRRLIE